MAKRKAKSRGSKATTSKCISKRLKVTFKVMQSLYSTTALLFIFANVLPDPNQDLSVQTIGRRTFHLFNKLPTEIRLIIWNLCLPSRRRIDLSAKFYKTPSSKVPTYSPLLRACRESRSEILRKYILLEHPLTPIYIIPRHLVRARKWSGIFHAPKILFLPSRDRLCVNMVFNESTGTLEVDDGYDGDLFAGWLIKRFMREAREKPSCFRGVEEVEVRDWYGEMRVTLTLGKRCFSLVQAWEEAVTRIWVEGE